MLSKAAEHAFVSERIKHDAFADPNIASPELITIPSALWPAGLKPVVKQLQNQPPGTAINSAASAADVLIITYTIDEARALSYVFTGSNNFEKSWYPYGHNFQTIKPKITSGLTDDGKPTQLSKGTLAYLLPVTIGTKNVMLGKSELHPADNGKQLPFIDLVQQLVAEIKPSLVITGGTGGAVGTTVNCGDVVITETALFHCEDSYPNYPQIPTIKSTAPQTPLSNTYNVGTQHIQYAIQNFSKLIVPGLQSDLAKLKAGKYAIDYVKLNTAPTIYVNQVPNAKAMNVLSADYFSVDDSKDSEGLQELGIMDDMDDAFVALAIKLAGNKTKWLSVRNASEPQMPYMSSQQDLKTQATQIYDTCGYHTSLHGAFAYWAIVAG